MSKRLFLLDGMALAYRAHFALAARPIYTSTGINTSALYGFTQTLLEIIRTRKPTHVAVAFDTEAPTHRHQEFADYKIQREAMPEDLSLALPHVRRMVEAFNIPVLTADGWEADDIIGTLVTRAGQEGFESYMVTPDKDFAQLITDKTFLFKPSRMGEGVEIWGIQEVLEKWGVQPSQVTDILGLWGDASDNIPGVPGIGEKTACKLIHQYESVENLLAHTGELKGKLKENLEANREQALLSKRLATICTEVPLSVELDCLLLRGSRDEELRKLCTEFEFNSIGKRLFGEEFRAGRSGISAGEMAAPVSTVTETESILPPSSRPLKKLADLPHDYRQIRTEAELSDLVKELKQSGTGAFALRYSRDDPKRASLLGVAVSLEPGEAKYLPLSNDPALRARQVAQLGEWLCDEQVEKVAHDLKFLASLLRWNGLCLKGPLFDTLIAHSLVEPDSKHDLGYVCEVLLDYIPTGTEGSGTQLDFGSAFGKEDPFEPTAEAADLAGQLKSCLVPVLKKKGQERVFYEIESPLVNVLVEMEFQGIRVDVPALSEFGSQLTREMAALETTIHQLAGREFNLNSPRQLGEVLFDVLKIIENPKKTKTGQYSTDEQTLTALATEHEIVRQLLEYRTASKLKSTYADALPAAVWPGTGKIHTTFLQAVTSTGRLNSQNPNIQNIPIRTEKGREIRKAFVPRDADFLLLSADYSQIELRIIAALSGEAALIEAFKNRADVHTTTAARVFGVPDEQVTGEMRRKAKMVNYGIAYGISAFGLAQRLAIPRKEAAFIIEQYFSQFPGIRKFMSDTIEFARENGYVQTVTGRRRYIRDIRSSNATVRGAAERNAINAPIQGTAADMIKIAMTRIHSLLEKEKLGTRLLLQVHDELVFDLLEAEKETVEKLVREQMETAIALEVPIEVEMGVGKNWLEAH